MEDWGEGSWDPGTSPSYLSVCMTEVPQGHLPTVILAEPMIFSLGTVPLASPATKAGTPSAQDAKEWLLSRGLLPELSPTQEITDEAILRRYLALSKCAFGEGVSEAAKQDFLLRLLPCEHRLAAKQTDIGAVTDPKYHYQLRLRNAVPIRAKPMRLRP